MELSNARAIKDMSGDALWLLWVDDEIWGHTDTFEDAAWFLTMISAAIIKELQKDHPQWTIELVSIEEKVVKVKCLHPGYVYNSRWTAHTVRYEPVFKLQKDASLVKLKRAPSVDVIKNIEKNSTPATRPPTPRPDEKYSRKSLPPLPHAPILIQLRRSIDQTDEF
uniref:Uncharacterized protein n=1 Tax=Marseillevirus LCMAC202 TaxID=2506606 RepID=A0A481YY31_9VIRU|nr:MAG: hypothetical protein LCMAC202_00610 [Marseillevirus LCMAC202]